VQEIERRLREVELGADVERAKLRQMLGEMRMLRQFAPEVPESAIDRTLIGPYEQTVVAEGTLIGIKDVVVTTRYPDGVVADIQTTDEDGLVSVMVPIVAPTIEYECPRYLKLGPIPFDEVNDNPELGPDSGYRKLNANDSTLWANHWEAWKDTIVVTDSIRGTGNIGSGDSTAIGTFTGSDVTYKVKLSGGVPAVEIRWFFGSSFVTYDFTYPLAGDITASVPALTGDARSSRFTMSKTRTLSFVNNNPWASGGTSFSLTLTVQEAL
jgi:hypothetical protein